MNALLKIKVYWFDLWDCEHFGNCFVISLFYLRNCTKTQKRFLHNIFLFRYKNFSGRYFGKQSERKIVRVGNLVNLPSSLFLPPRGMGTGSHVMTPHWAWTLASSFTRIVCEVLVVWLFCWCPDFCTVTLAPLKFSNFLILKFWGRHLRSNICAY